MAAEKSGNDPDQSDLENVSGTMVPKLFVGPMELGVVTGENLDTHQPAKKGSTMHIAEYQHRLHEAKRMPLRTIAIGAPSSFDERHPSHDVQTTEPRESEKQGNNRI